MSDFYIPSNPEVFSFRPLNKGMQTNVTESAMPDGSFLHVKGFNVVQKGLERVGGWEPSIYDATTALPAVFPFELPAEERIEDMGQLSLANGTKVTFVLTNRFMYTVSRDFGYAPVTWIHDYEVATITETTDTEITVSGDFTEDYLDIGDIVVFGDERLPVSGVTATISTLTLTLTGTFDTPPVSTDTFSILKPFKADGEYFVDFVEARNNIYLVDGASLLVFRFDGTVLHPHIIENDTPERTVMGARTITFMGERLFFGDVIEYDTSTTQYFFNRRVRWTDALDFSVSLSAYYQDLSRGSGRIVKLLGMGGLLIAYMTDSIFYGAESNLSGLPYAFTLIETGTISAVGMKAMTSYFDGQLFVGPDNAYYIGSDATVQPMGSLIAETLAASMGSVHLTYIRNDIMNNRILIATSSEGEALDNWFTFNYKAKAWSMFDAQLLAPTPLQFGDTLLYSELGSDTYETSWTRYLSYASLLFGATSRSLFAFQPNGYLLEYMPLREGDAFVNASGTVDPTSAVPVEIITPDYDFDAPDTDKTALRLSVRIVENSTIERTTQLRLRVEASTDNGQTYRYLGTMMFRPGRTEDALNFRVTGSTIRFKLTSGQSATETNQLLAPYLISEVALKTRTRGDEAVRSNSRLHP